MRDVRLAGIEDAFRFLGAGRMPALGRDGYAFWWWTLADLVGDDVDPAIPLAEQAALLRSHGARALVGEFEGLADAATQRIPELAGG